MILLNLINLQKKQMTINDLKEGQTARIIAVGGRGKLRTHLLDMGIIPESFVKMVGRAPMGDPLELYINGYSLTLRTHEASEIQIQPCNNPEITSHQTQKEIDFGYNLTLHEHNSHPGFGEEGKYHNHAVEHALPKDQKLTFALAGQQNCGKTTLFNLLTGSNQHVGNFPGVTVDRKDGAIIGRPNTLITDLPGIYSLSAYTAEETVSRDFILKEKPCAIINIADAGNLERHLYLTVQLMEFGIPMVLALNMMDELRGNGGSIRINQMERILGLPVVPISAARNEGVEELVQHAVHVARYQEKPSPSEFYNSETCIGEDREAELAQMRYSYIRDLCRRTVKKPVTTREYLRSRKIDRILTGRWTAIPLFVLIMTSVIFLSIDVLGAPLQALLQSGIDRLAEICAAAMTALGVSPTVESLVVDAIIGGVGSVVSFIPVIILLFFFLSILEDSGYMARVAFVTDKVLRHFGLSGRSIVPLIIGFGCSVPAVMAARTLPSARDRRITVLLTPFMSCSAKIPIYAFLSAAFFPGYGGLVLICLYLFSILCGIAVAFISKYLGRKRDAAPFVMELPNYRMPRALNVGHLLWDKSKDFLQRAFSVIFIATIVIWLLQTFDWRFRMVADPSASMLAAVAGWIAPLFEPLGLGDWRIITSLISGFMAKESVVATMKVLDVLPALALTSAVPLLIFCLLYTPCVAATAAVRRELGRLWALYVIVFQCAFAWCMAFAAALIVRML